MRSLVTGGAGFLGSYVARECVRLGHTVTVLDDLSGGARDNVPAGCHFVHGSIVDSELLGPLFETGRFDYVYHLAAYAAEGLSHFIRRFNYTNNLIGSVNLINESVKHDVRCFVFTSSIAVYGAGQVPITEDQQPLPEDPYGIAKYAVELDLKRAFEMFGLKHVVFRPHNVYGERQNINDPYRNVIGIFARRALERLPLPIFGDGLQTRAFSHADDVAPFIAASPEIEAATNEIFNVGADEPTTVLDIARLVSNAAGVELKLDILPTRHEVKHAWASHAKMERVFGHHEKVALAEGIARMVHWARGERLAPPTAFAGVEVEKNLPPSWAKLLEA
jgi:UDP-glucose 4-epimerase